MNLRRKRINADGTLTLFTLPTAARMRIEIEIYPRHLPIIRKHFEVIAVRMSGVPKGKRRQTNLVPISEIENW